MLVTPVSLTLVLQHLDVSINISFKENICSGLSKWLLAGEKTKMGNNHATLIGTA